jgi:hypothetical protein
MNDTPTRRTLQLRNGNRQGDWNNAPRCGARTCKGMLCRSAAMPSGQCRMHGARGRAHRKVLANQVSAHEAWSLLGRLDCRRRALRQAIRAIRELLRSATTTEDDVLDARLGCDEARHRAASVVS